MGYFGWTAQSVGNQVVLCGGSDVGAYPDCYCLSAGSAWEKCGQMDYPRRYADSSLVNGEMIITGGYNFNQGWLSSVEYGKTEKPEWEMPRKVFDHCMVARGNLVYVIGRSTLRGLSRHVSTNFELSILGGNVYGEFETSDVDILDTTTGTWKKGISMAKERDRHACMLYEHKGEMGILVTGGEVVVELTHI